MSLPPRPPELPDYFRYYGDEERYDAFEMLAGPFFYAQPPDVKAPTGAFVIAPQHFNMSKFLHGGLLMSFADFTAFVVAEEALGEQHAVTLSLQSDFIRADNTIGAIVYGTGQVTRATRNIVFVRGEITCQEQVLLTYATTLKILRR